jgi:hypothetical protein
MTSAMLGLPEGNGIANTHFCFSRTPKNNFCVALTLLLMKAGSGTKI